MKDDVIVNKMLSFYPRTFDTTSRQVWNIDYAIEAIRCGWNNLASRISRLRTTPRGDEYDRLKRNLPAVTFAGVFDYRSESCIRNMSPFVCLDFDHVPNPEALKKELSATPYIYAAFVSPSGHGVKAVILTNDNTPDQYRMKYTELMEVFSLSCKADESCVDISRLTYLSYDPDIYHNPEAVPYLYSPRPEATSEIKRPYEVKRTDAIVSEERSDTDFLNKLSMQTGSGMTDKQILRYKEKQWRNAEFYQVGHRQSSLLKQASSLCSYGVKQSEALTYLLYRFGKAGLTEEEIITKVAYCYNTTPFASRRQEVIQERDVGKAKATNYYLKRL